MYNRLVSALDCSGFHIKCDLLNGRGFGCAPVCDGSTQCQDFDEDLGKFSDGYDKCEEGKYSYTHEYKNVH